MVEINKISTTEFKFKQLVRTIRSGSDVVIYSPKSESSFMESDRSEAVTDTSIAVEETIPRIAKPVNLTTKTVEEGEALPILPSWIYFNFDPADYSVKTATLDAILQSDYANTKNYAKNQGWMESENHQIDKLFKSKDVNSNINTYDSHVQNSDNANWMEKEAYYNLDNLFETKTDSTKNYLSKILLTGF